MREATTFSRILEMKMRFEIGRKLLRSSEDRDGFLRRGWTRAYLNDDGKIPSETERLTKFVMTGPSSRDAKNHDFLTKNKKNQIFFI